MSTDVSNAKPPASLEVLKTIRKAQLTNGLRHGDYARYKSYCTRRIQRIRKSLKFLHGSRYHKKEIDPQNVTDPRFLELVLMMSERAWSHAMQLKDDTENYRAKFHAFRRLGKAAKHASLLMALANKLADDRTKLECDSYSSFLTGSVLLEDEKWAEACKNFIRAKTVYEELAKVGTPEQQELYLERVGDIEPTIRYCQFSLTQAGQNHESVVKMMSEADRDSGHSLDLLKGKIDNVLADIRKKEAQTMNEVVWKTEKIPIRNETLRLAILSANDVSYELDQVSSADVEQKLQIYDKLFIQYNDAIKAVTNEITTLKSSKKQGDTSSLESLEEYLNYNKLVKTMERNLMLVDSLEKRILASETDNEVKPPKPDEFVRLYEFLIDNISQINAFDDDDEKKQKVNAAKLVTYRALRILYLAEAYVTAAKYGEAVLLFSKAQMQIKDALSHHNECTPVDTAAVSKLTEAYNHAAGQSSYVRAKAYLDSLNKEPVTETNTKPVKANTVILDQLNEYDASFLSTKIIDFPPNLEPIPCKPILFDLALSSITFPDLSEKKKAPRTGFFSSFWGR
eukprot:TRINITY_DN11410_c0_g1_i1.p1 TRINITY_DN11410_c0_g1~~TRINITY_DN11410_c0_g1_i1.p1  ORF type:complete len:568 (-),score=148.50 TRINITY_DN11410_c0_g1_i1:91-1794(-)